MLTHLTLLLDKQHADKGGKEFCYFGLNFLAHASVNCFDTVGAETNDAQLEDDTSIKKKDAQSEEKSAGKRGKEFRCFCMNFLAHATANANTFDIAHRESICGYG